MKNLNKKAFTLIELLIVIALLGALAVGLLAALDPFEQLKKGTDTGIRNTVSELQGAAIRFYAIKNYMPWCSDATTCTDPEALKANAAAATTIIDRITATGELKSDFITLAGDGNLSRIYITGSNATATIAVCYRPTAKSFLADPNSKFTSNGGTGTACNVAIDATCFWCVK